MKNLLERINALAKKQKSEVLTEQEIQEREELRKEYIKQFRAGMTDILDNTYIKKPDGTLKKLQKK